MDIDDILEVVVDPNGGYKFIVAKLTDSNGREKLVVRAKGDCNYHDQIFRTLQREVYQSGLSSRCMGGGRIKVNSEMKTILIWDNSAAFGKEPNREETVRMLQAAFPDFQVTSN